MRILTLVLVFSLAGCTATPPDAAPDVTTTIHGGGLTSKGWQATGIYDATSEIDSVVAQVEYDLPARVRLSLAVGDDREAATADSIGARMVSPIFAAVAWPAGKELSVALSANEALFVWLWSGPDGVEQIAWQEAEVDLAANQPIAVLMTGTAQDVAVWIEPVVSGLRSAALVGTANVAPEKSSDLLLQQTLKTYGGDLGETRSTGWIDVEVGAFTVGRLSGAIENGVGTWSGGQPRLMLAEGGADRAEPMLSPGVANAGSVVEEFLGPAWLAPEFWEAGAVWNRTGIDTRGGDVQATFAVVPVPPELDHLAW